MLNLFDGKYNKETAAKVIERTETVASQGKYGSYTITFESGMKYHGKGPKSRMERSIKEKFELYGDRAISSDWSPAATERDAFIDEALRIRGDGGVGMEYGNYNKINSPGEKLLREKETRR